jgi:hypothetical protein
VGKGTVAMVHADKLMCVGNWHNLQIFDICADIDRAALRKMEETAQALYKQYPQGIVSMSLIRQGMGMPSSEVRQESSRLMKQQRAMSRKSVVVLESGGMMGSLIQTVVRGLNILSPNQKLDVVTTIDAGCRAVVPLIHIDGVEKVAAADVAAAITTLRAKYAERSF